MARFLERSRLGRIVKATKKLLQELNSTATFLERAGEHVYAQKHRHFVIIF